MSIVELQTRHALTSDWTADNPTLKQGEFGNEYDDGDGHYIGTKVGDDTTAWNDLDYINSTGGATGAAGGDLSGTYPNPTIATGAVTSAKIADGTITDADVNAANKDGTTSTPSLRTLGVGATQAAAGNDSRLSDSRAPNGSAGGDLTGTYPNPTIASGAVSASKITTGTITDVQVAAANKDGIAATASMRTLGTGSTQAAAGNDSRLSDSRAPNGSAGGDLTGTYPNPTIAAGAVGTSKIADAAVTGGTAGAGVKIAATTITAANIANATITDVQVAAANKDGASGTASLRTLGVGAAQAAAGNDSRLSDSRAPNGSAGGDLTGTYPNPTIANNAVTAAKIANATITDVQVASANKDGASGTASMRTLGAGGSQAAAGNDSRLSDARTPTAHHTTHESGGTDAITIAESQVTGLTTDLSGKVGTGDSRLSDDRYLPRVRLASGANKDITTALANGQVLDSNTIVTGDRLLLFGQTDPTQNGVYIAPASGTASRATDVLSTGARWYATEGKANGNYIFALTTTGSIVVGTTSITIARENQDRNGYRVRAVTTSSITISSIQPGSVIDGVTLAESDKFLCVAQSTASQNGVYVCPATSATAGRAGDNLASGTQWLVTEGTTYAGSQWIVTTANPITLGTTSITILPFKLNVQQDDYTSAGSVTWTKPVGAKRVKVVCISSGAGGGSGRTGGAASARGGGGGGAAGIRVEGWYDAADLGSTENVTVGAGGTGGPAQTSTTTDGNPGNDGAASFFGLTTNRWLSAQPPTGGNAGSTPSGGTGGGAAAPGGAVGAAGGVTAAGTSTNTAVGRGTSLTAGGGAGGGGVSTGNVAFAGGTGGNGPTASNSTAAGGTNTGGNGGSGNAAKSGSRMPGGGGGGGGANVTSGSAAGAGGNGGAPGGGGAGGGGATGAGPSGAGGNGADGAVYITTYFS